MRRRGLVTGMILPIMLSLIPGWGHLWLRRPLRGLLLFILFFTAVDYWAMTAIFVERTPPVPVKFALATAAAAAAWSIVDVIRICFWIRSRSAVGRREASFRSVIGHWMRDELGQADELAGKLLRVDPVDPAALVWSATIRAGLGRRKEAARLLERARKADRDERWLATIRRAHEELAAGRRH